MLPHLQPNAARGFAGSLDAARAQPTVERMLSMALLAASGGTGWIQLGAAVAAAAGLAVVMQRRRAAGPRPHSIPLTSQHAVHIVQAGEARLVIGTGPGAAPHLLYELPTRTERQPAQRPPASAGWDAPVAVTEP